jgi:short-subunit dehydrogenase
MRGQPSSFLAECREVVGNRKAGTLIYTSSRAANANSPWTTAYNCSKIATTRFAGSLQIELDRVQKVEE